MILINLALFIVSLFVLLKCAGYAIKYSSKIARAMHLPEFLVSFFIIAIVSVLPEATVSIMSAIQGDSSLGLGTLLGSNIADLTIIFGIAALFSPGGIKIQSKTLRNNFYYLILLLFPLLLGFDGRLSRVDGGILMTIGILFFYKIYKDSRKFTKKFNEAKKERFSKSLILLLLSLAVLLISAFFTVKYAENFAHEIKIPVIIIGVTVLALGTSLPEMAFSIKAVKKNHDDLALGDILGTVVTDATILLGLIALINPFSYNPYSMYLMGGAVFLSAVFAFSFMRSDKSIDKKEGVILIFIYIIFVLLEFLMSTVVS